MVIHDKSTRKLILSEHINEQLNQLTTFLLPSFHQVDLKFLYEYHVNSLRCHFGSREGVKVGLFPPCCEKVKFFQGPVDDLVLILKSS